jgi:hypothetical protein
VRRLRPLGVRSTSSAGAPPFSDVESAT